MPHRLKTLEVLDWGLSAYPSALDRQRRLVEQRLAGMSEDRLILVEHFPVVTVGKTGGSGDLLLPPGELKARGIELHFVDRGGLATCHGPGQMVAYPIVKLETEDLQQFVATILEAVARVVRAFGLEPERKNSCPGIWVRGRKIASIGVAVRRGVTYHGVALNVSNDLSLFDCVVPCGRVDEPLTSLQNEIGAPVDLGEVKQNFIREFCDCFRYHDVRGFDRHPSWLRRPFQQTGLVVSTDELVWDMNLRTVCESALCPNMAECFGQGTATFLILGDRCTRNCRFCAIHGAVPEPPDPDEPRRVALAVQKMNLPYVVVTSVTRDDLVDGGASHFVGVMKEIRRLSPGTRIEVLVPDFMGRNESILSVCRAGPAMFNHNIETVPRLYGKVRPGASFQRSLKVLALAAEAGHPVKSGMMLGLGERADEIESTLAALLDTGCRYLTLGQYLAPSSGHLPVKRYVKPGEFDGWSRTAKQMGFREVAAGPLVRSSYRAHRMMPVPEELPRVV